MPTGVQKPTRRFHKKSRTGCTQCRSRRIKVRLHYHSEHVANMS